MKQIKIIISGRVQGIGFRYWTRNIARRQSISGTVQNKEDGTVEIFAQSDEDTLKNFIDTVSQGSPLSDIENVTVKWSNNTQKFEGFEIKR